MMSIADLRQLAASKCLERGKLNDINPYSGPYYHAALKTVRRDALRRQASQDRRILAFPHYSPEFERYSAEQRYDRCGLNSDDPAKIVEAREEITLLNRSIAALGAQDREVIVECDLQAEKTTDVALTRGESTDAVRSRRYHAHVKIRRNLQGQGASAA